MGFPIKICAICEEEFELKPGKPGFANHCPECSAEAEASASQAAKSGDDRQNAKDVNEARRQAMRQLLYSKDS